MRIQNNKGFTLIELMVVISIIGLLSSIVLASLKDARDKANVTKFKAEIKQMINALELYRGDNGKYPYEGFTYRYHVQNNNMSIISSGGELFSPSILSKYMKTRPKVPANSYNQKSIAWSYFANPTTDNPEDNYFFRCTGDSALPKYLILIYANNPLLFKAFPELKTLESDDDIFFEDFSTFDPVYTKCFSLK